MEAARITIARINDWAAALSERESLAAEFAERFATDRLEMDDAFWERLHGAFRHEELVELGLCVSSWLAFGRMNRVFDVDGVCRVPEARVGGRAV